MLDGTASSRPFDLLVAGEINPDLILTGDVEPVFGQVEKCVESAHLTIGSSSVIFACGAARLGLRVAFVGKCGDDLFGRFMLEAMQAYGIDTRAVKVVQGGKTGLSVILNRGNDRAILTFPGLIAALTAGDVTDDLLQQARHLHIASYFLQTALQSGLPDLFRRARRFGLTTSLDPNYDPGQSWQGIRELLAWTDVFLPNQTEACSLTGMDDPVEAARALGRQVHTLAMKWGAQGAAGVQHEQMVLVPALSVDVVDTVGAGDSFDAGFLYGYLHGWTLEDCLRMGVICGSLSTRAAGGTEAQPTLAEALGVLQRGKA